MKVKTHDFCGTTIYECPFCRFDSEFLPTLKKHIHDVHLEAYRAAVAEAQCPQATLYDASGELVTEMPVPAETAAALAAVERMTEDVQPQLEESE